MGIIENMRLDGKKGFVTGAARGIGKCTATAFAEAGADVAIVDLDIEEAKKTAKELAEKTGRKVNPDRLHRQRAGRCNGRRSCKRTGRPRFLP